MSTTLSQPAQMAACAYAGLLMGIFRDLLNMLLPAERVWLNALKDTLFWAGCTVLAAVTLYMANGLIVRPFTLACFLCGFLLWRFAATPFIMGAYRFIKKSVCAVMRRVCAMLR